MNAPIEYEQTDSRWRDIIYSPIGNFTDNPEELEEALNIILSN